MTDIKLGDKVKDRVTDFTGIVVARTKFLNGCIQYMISGKIKGGEKYPFEGDVSIDEMNLKVIKRNVVNSSEYEKPKPKKTNGGATKYMKGMKGY